MALCANCGYMLVLLPKRRRYKCAKCSGLYPEKFIDNREFQRFNQIQRELIKEETAKEFEEIWKAYKGLNPVERKPPKPRKRLSEEERRLRARECRKRYKEKNRVKILLWKKRYRERHRDKLNAKERQRKDKIRAHLRIALKQRWHEKKQTYNRNRLEKKHLRKALVLQAIKNEGYTPKEGGSSSQMAEFYFFNYFV